MRRLYKFVLPLTRVEACVERDDLYLLQNLNWSMNVDNQYKKHLFYKRYVEIVYYKPP
jgi:hypothetical protein